MLKDTGNVVTADLLLVPASPGDWTPKVPRGSTYLELEHHLDADPSRLQRPWFIHSQTGEQLLASEVIGLSRRYGALLHRHGLRRGQVVHLLLDAQDVRVLLIGFGVWINGGVLSFGDPDLEAEGISQQLEDADCSFVVASPANIGVARSAIAMLCPEQRPKILCLGWSKEDCNDGMVDLQAALGGIREEDCPEPEYLDVMEDTALILYTSGRPKGVIHTHFSIWHWSINIDTMIPSDTTVVFNLRTSNFVGFRNAVTCLFLGNTLIHSFPTASLVQSLLSAIEKYQPSVLILNGGQMLEFAESPLVEKVQTDRNVVLGSVRSVRVIAGTLPEVTEHRLRELLPNMEAMMNVLGSSEAGPICYSTTHAGGRVGSLVQGMEAKVVDPEMGKRVGPGIDGELRVRSQLKMKGYLQLPKETADYWDEEGFGKTGDLVRYDDKGDLFYVDRLKEIIPVGRLYVAPRELEAILQEHKAVQECLVWGRSTATREQVDLEEELLGFANLRLPKFKQIKCISFHDRLPRNKLGKLVRREMKKQLEKEEADLLQ